MLTKDWLDNQTKRLEEINKTISELFWEQIKILEDTRKELLELIDENNILLTSNWEEPYDTEEIGRIENGTKSDINSREIDKYNSEDRDFKRRKEERLWTIYNLLDDNKRFKTKTNSNPVDTVI